MAAERRRRGALAVVALAVLASASSSCSREAMVTHLRVEVDWEAPIEVDQLRFEVVRGTDALVTPATRPEIASGLLTSPATVAILLPERALGQALSVRVTGLRDGAEVTSGRADGVNPLPDRGIDVSVRLGRRLVEVRIDPAPAALPLGFTEPFTAQAVYSDDTTEDVTEQATWFSSNSAIVGVETAEGARGLVSAVAQGTATVSATFADLTGESVVSVGPVRLVSVSITPNTLLLATGMSGALSATGAYSDGMTADLTTMTDWSTTDPNVATVGNAPTTKGLVTGAQPGFVTINARVLGVTAQANVSVVVPTLAQLVISPNDLRLPRGYSQTLTATGFYTDGNSFDLSSAVTWSTSDASKATINAGGRLTGVSVGDITVTASLLGVTGTRTGKITSATLTQIMVTPTNPTVPKGTPVQMRATGVFDDGSTLDLTTAVTWMSSNNSVTTVDSQGTLNTLAAGTSTISASLGLTATSLVTVTDATLQTIMVQPGQLTLPRNARQGLKAIGQYSDGTTSDLTTLASWSSSAPATASVSPSGVLTALMPGMADITATFGAKSGTAKLTVSTATLTAIDVSPASATVQLGAEQKLTATARYSDGTNRDVTAEATWTTSNAVVAQVSSAGSTIGRVTGAGGGTATITATLDGVAGQSSITVEVVTLVGVGVSPARPALTIGASQQLSCVATYSNMTTADVTAQATWSTSAATVAQVSNATDSRGLATGVSAGSATIGCAFDGRSASTTLTVSTAVLQAIAVVPTAAKLARGTARQYRADGSFSDGRVRDVTALASWTTSDAAVAQVTSDETSRGRVSGNAAGSATITATIGGISGVTSVQVTNAMVMSIALTPTDASVAEGNLVHYMALATFDDATLQDLTDQVTWTSSDTRIATITSGGPDSGLARATKKGVATIAATFAALTSTTKLTVRMASLQSIAIMPASPSVAVGRTVALRAIGSYNGGLTVDITEQAAWSSSAITIASVGSGTGNRGAFTGVAVGSATITAAFGNRTGTTSATVSAPVFDSVVVTPPSASLNVNQTLALTATAYLSDQSSQNVTTSASWMSSSPAAVTVNDAAMKGLCRGVATGSSTISATAGGVTGRAAISVP